MSSNKTVVLVTGSSKGGIGFSLCEEFASRGCTVYATARRLEAMEGFSQPNIHTLSLDVTSDESVQKAVETIIEREGRIDVLINNAGLGNTGAIIDVPMDEIVRMFDTNVYAVIRMAKAVIPHMAARKSGTIVNVGSIAGEIPVPWGGIYGATKAALHSLTETLYMECKPLDINVVLLAPGGVKSNIANNQAPRFKLPENSLYSAYIDSMLAKLTMSQRGNSMPAEQFSQQVVSAVLKPQPPRYMTLASMSGMYKVLKWLPRTWVLNMFWRRLGEGPRLAALKNRK
ncbi:NAD-P-binding protein [Trametes coccinea BRFM310]|uniref:NAD-P-binding protein n=1 Tax=Trametes coccinea (strain BRFM310) TaxID=1353009 RepID=A0A1Y2IQJ4_TRAC3|nr:NAD-P-binding protein [Trametes coccinea BRFM310]